MIIFGSAVTDANLYDRCALKGINLAKEDDSIVLAHQSTGTLFRNYNLVLDLAKEHEGMEALVLLHQDAEICDPNFIPTLREAFSDPDVAIVGCAGAVGVRSIAWWEGAVTWASFTHRYTELGGGQFDSMSWDDARTPSISHTGEVDVIDGFVLAMSPWAVENLRFDEALGKLHGYDFDICCQAREKGKKVITADMRVIHHHSLDLISDPETWMEAYIRLAEKWEGRLPHLNDPGTDLHARALRAEADAAAAKGAHASGQLRYQALERHYFELTNTAAWRFTEKLRRLRNRLTPSNGARARKAAEEQVAAMRPHEPTGAPRRAES